MNRIALVLFALVIASTALADDDRPQSTRPSEGPGSPTYSERVDVVIANVDVVVTDRQGNPVRGLTKADFEIRENGELQTITSFTAFDAKPASEFGETPDVVDSADTPAPTMPPRLFVLFFDIGDTAPNRRERFFSSVRGFLDEAFRDGDVVAVLSWSRRINVILEPTQDRQRLDVVLEGLSIPFGSARSRNLKILRELADLAIEDARRDEELSMALGAAIVTDAATEEDFQEWMIAEQRCQQIKRKATEMRNILTTLSRIEMRKVLLFASDDLTLQPAPGCSTVLELAELAGTANAYGMTIHALHPPGPRDDGLRVDTSYYPRTNDPIPMATEYFRAFDESAGLNLLAEHTGGLFSMGLESPKVLAEVARGLDSYYSLGYRMSPGNEDRSRKVEVTTKNEAYRVRARQSVVRLSEASRIRDLVTSSLYLPEMPGKDVPSFEARVTKSKEEGRFVIADVEVSIRARDLVLLPTQAERLEGSFSVFLSAGRLLGDASDVVEMTRRVGSYSTIENDSRLVYTFQARIRPDTRRLSLAVRDNVSGEVGLKVITLDSL